MSKQSKAISVLGKEELGSRLVELRKELIKLSSQVATGTAIKNPGQLKNVKKNIARILTFQKQKPIQAKPQGGQKK